MNLGDFKMLKLKGFAKSEDGAVTVDWVVLTAAVVGLGIAVIATVQNGATSKAAGVGATVGSLEPGSM